MYPSRDREGAPVDAAQIEAVERQGRLLRALLEDEEALRPVIEALGGEITEYYAGVEGEEMFTENIDLLLFSTPVKCLGVRGQVVGVNEEGGEPD